MALIQCYIFVIFRKHLNNTEIFKMPFGVDTSCINLPSNNDDNLPMSIDKMSHLCYLCGSV